MKRRAAVFCSVLLFCAVFLSACAAPQTEERALERLKNYAHAIDYDYESPEKIYPFLTAEFRNQMGREDFVQAFVKERSYPYITPLYIYDPVITLDEDGLGGTAIYMQAARIIGMTYTVRFVYENGDWYISDWDKFLDGSYLDKFDDVPYSLDWYYDVEETGEN